MIEEGKLAGFGEPGFDEIAPLDGGDIVSGPLRNFKNPTTCRVKKGLGDPILKRMAFDEATDFGLVSTDC